MAFSLGNSANSIPPQSDPVRNVQPLRGRSRCCHLILMLYANLCNAAQPAKQPCAVINFTGNAAVCPPRPAFPAVPAALPISLPPRRQSHLPLQPGAAPSPQRPRLQHNPRPPARSPHRSVPQPPNPPTPPPLTNPCNPSPPPPAARKPARSSGWRYANTAAADVQADASGCPTLAMRRAT